MKLVSSLACALAVSAAGTAYAQQAVIAADADVLMGIEGGSSGYAKGIRRSRTSLRLGAQGYVDEYPSHAFSAALMIELEPHASFGFDVRYMYRISDFVLHLGPVAVLAPRTLIGATAGAAYELELAENFALDFGPAVQVFFLGSDLPERTVLWQVLGQAGARVRF